MRNLLLRAFGLREKITPNHPVYGEQKGFNYPGRYMAINWDAINMKVTNFPQANQFVKRANRKTWGELKLSAAYHKLSGYLTFLIKCQ